MITDAEIAQHRASGAWRVLERRAQTLIKTAQLHGGESFAPILGGGTRLMLAINHRISDDIDLFVSSPGWLPHVSPRLNDEFEDVLSSYHEDSGHVKLRFKEGEIDFIASPSLLDPAHAWWNPPASETTLDLEPPAEILAKKLFFRGWSLTPRDLFDWVALEQAAPPGAIPHEALATLLSSKFDLIRTALSWLGKRELSKRTWSEIQTPTLPDLDASITWALGELDRLQQLQVQLRQNAPAVLGDDEDDRMRDRPNG